MATESAPTQTPAPVLSGNNPLNLMSRMGGVESSFIQNIPKTVLAIATLISIGMFSYQMYLSAMVQNKKDDIASYEKKLTVLPLEDMRDLSNRLKFINQLVKDHPSVNVALRLVEDSVEDKVSYSSFDLAYDSGEKAHQITLLGTAPDYKTLVQQVDALKQDPYTKYISEVVVKNVEPDAVGSVGFSLLMNVLIKGLLPEDLLLGVVDPVANENTDSSIPLQTSTSSQDLITAPVNISPQNNIPSERDRTVNP